MDPLFLAVIVPVALVLLIALGVALIVRAEERHASDRAAHYARTIASTPTGRVRPQPPLLLNLPQRTGTGIALRAAAERASPGWGRHENVVGVVNNDYAQAEMRAMAALAVLDNQQADPAQQIYSGDSASSTPDTDSSNSSSSFDGGSSDGSGSSGDL